ncbi:hypothetical protein RB213_000605 [Colletotrichum asianum]
MPHPDLELHKDPKCCRGLDRIEKAAKPIIFGQIKGSGIDWNSTIVVIAEPPLRNTHQHHCLTTATGWHRAI